MADRAFDSHGHLTPEGLGALHEGRLDPEIEERARFHVVACGACQRDLKDLAAFEQSDDVAGRDLADSSVQSAWRGLVGQLPRSPERARPAADAARAPALGRAPDSAALRSRSTIKATAAMVAALLGLFILLLLWRLEAIPGAPWPRQFTVWPNVPIVDLDPAPAVTRSLEARPARTPIACGQGVVLILHSDDMRTFDRTRLSVHGSGTEPVLTQDGLERSASGYYTVALSCGDLPRGPLAIHIEGVTGGELTTIEIYHVDIRRP